MKKAFILLLWFTVASQIPPQYCREKSTFRGVYLYISNHLFLNF